MFRDDGRCGDGYQIDGTKMPAMCDPTSDKPCCNKDNHCSADCECQTCIDYSMGMFL